MFYGQPFVEVIEPFYGGVPAMAGGAWLGGFGNVCRRETRNTKRGDAVAHVC